MKRLLIMLRVSALLLGTLTLTACDKTEPEDGTSAPAETPAADDPGQASAKDGTLTVTSDDAVYDASTVDEALARARELRQGGYTGPIGIRFNGGEYLLSEPVVIDETTPDLTIEAADGVRLLGGVRIEGFSWDEFNGVRCLSAAVPNEDFTDFYVNGRAASLTRYPLEGFLKAEAVEGAEDGKSVYSRGITAAEGDMQDFRNLQRVQVSFYNSWVDEHSRIESYDPETRLITMRYSSGVRVSNSLEYFLENTAETFGRPDDWYVESGKVYYVPRDDSITPESIEAYIPVAMKLFDIRGTAEAVVRGITLRGLDLRVTSGDYTPLKGDDPRASDSQAAYHADGAVSFRYAEDCVIEDCSITEYGQYGVVFEPGCRNDRMSRCTLTEGGAGGVRITGDENEGVPENTEHVTVEDSVILRIGRRWEQGCGVLIQDAGFITIQHNEIGETGYTGVSCGWCWGYYGTVTHDNLITKNHIHDIGRGHLSDMGGVYLLGPQPGTVVSYNLIHDIQTGTYGAWGLYADEGCSDVIFEKNVVYRAQSNAFEQHYGANNTVRNNIFAMTGGPLLKVSLYEDHHSVTFDTNILYADGTKLYDFDRNHLSHKTVSSMNNLIWSTSGDEVMAIDMGNDKVWSVDQVHQFFNMEEGSVVADPGFADPANGDFTLKPDSPAYELGFEPIDMSDVGPRK